MRARGEPMLWLTGGALVTCFAMVIGFLLWVAAVGLGTFWPSPIVRVVTGDGAVYMGELAKHERYRVAQEVIDGLPAESAARAAAEAAENEGEIGRGLLRSGNFDLTGTHFHWVDDFRVVERDEPQWALVVERLEWGRFYGFPEAYAIVTPRRVAPGGSEPVALEQQLADLELADGAEAGVLVERRDGGERTERLLTVAEVSPSERVLGVAAVWRGADAAWRAFQEHHAAVRDLWHSKQSLASGEGGVIQRRLRDAAIELRAAELELEPPAPWVAAYQRLDDARRERDPQLIEQCSQRLAAVEQELGAPSPEFLAVLERLERERAAAGRDHEDLRQQVRDIEAEMERHRLLLTTATAGQEKLLSSYEIVRAYPANQLGLGESLAVYGSRWWEFVSDEPRESNFEGGVFPAIFGTVLMTLIMCILVVPFGVLAALYLREYAKAGPVISMVRIAVNNLAGVPSIVFGVFGVGFFCYIVGSSIDELLFAARLPEPTFGTGGLLWASLTLALLTLPVVIVATEEALAAVPKSMREGSYACGASKWQTIRRIVLPRAMPGIMTGAILAMARGAGEVAPLMLVGAVKLAPKLPLDFADLPTFGVDRSFMHLGYHIYDLGFQSQNSEAAKPMVYTTTLLLIAIIALLNLTAIWLRGRLHRRFVANHF